MMATAVDAILVLVLLEGLGLILLRRLTGHGLPPSRLIATLAAGFFVMLALRVALGGMGDGAIAACLLVALVAHLLDLAGRWDD